MSTTHVSGGPPAEVPEEDNLTTRLWQRAEARPDTQVLRTPSDGAWQGLTWSQLADRVQRVAAGLVSRGVERGDRVALMSRTSLEWTVADLAILSAGGVTVPLYETSSQEQCAWVTSDAGTKLAIAGTGDHAKSLTGASGQRTDEVVLLEEAGLDELAERATEDALAQVADRAKAIGNRDIATIVYTSGTTGNPKGCRLTHGNLLWTARQVERDLDVLFGPNASTLLFLPLAHVFARIIQFGCFEADVTMGYARSMETLREDIASFAPTFLLGVPRVFEKVFTGAQRKAGGGVKGKVFEFAISAGQGWSQAVNAGCRPAVGTRVKHRIADALVYAKLREALGGQVTHCISGGAPLPPHLGHFFRAAGVPILEGYGLTETSAPVTANRPDAMRIGTVGRPLSGVDVRVAEDGELLIKGGNVFDGYWNNEAATRETFTDDGWLRSGDLGEVDEDGFVAITGRKKEIIVTAAGKNVAPAVLEERLKANRLVSQAMVVGDNRPFVAALIALDSDEVAAFAKEHDLTGSMAELANTPPVQAEVQRAVDHANAAVSRAEAIRKVAILDRELTQEDQELTPTLKVRREVVADHFSDKIEGLYAG